MRRNLASTFALALALVATGPVSADDAAISVVGKVTLGGQPLPLGKITFYVDDDQFVGSKIKDGAFKVTRIPAGQWRVAIEGDGVRASFGSEKTSPLTVSVQQGANIFDFALTK